MGYKVVFNGNYEPKSMALAVTLMSRGGLFLDIGCNVGLYTLVLARLPKVNVVAIDASAVAIAGCLRNIQMNPAAKIDLVNCALDSSNTLQSFEVAIPGNLGSTRVVRDGKPHAFRSWTASKTLQSILEILTPGKPRLLKIDVEGSEFPVFQGLDFNGIYRPEHIIMESLPDCPGATRCYEFLTTCGYQAMTVEGKSIQDLRLLPEQNVWFRDSTVSLVSEEKSC